MQRVRTESGSVYDVDRRGMRIRRAHGRHGPADTQPQDGIWRKIAGIEGPSVGQPMVVYWAKEAAGARDTDYGFRTTAVLEVSEVHDGHAGECDHDGHAGDGDHDGHAGDGDHPASAPIGEDR